MANVSSTSLSKIATDKVANDVSRDLLAELNNEGAFLLEHGEHSAAIKVLTSALNVAMRDVGCSEFLIPDQKPSDPYDTESVVSRSSSCHQSRRHQQQHSKHEKHSHRSKRHHRSKHRRLGHVASTSDSVLGAQPSITEDKLTHPQRSFVYGKPMRVADRYSLPSYVELTLYVVYNLAVSYHLRVLKRKRKGHTRVLREILRLYKLAHSIQVREEIGLEPTHTLALWNNLGQAYKSLGKDSKSDFCFNNVLSNIICMIDHGCTEDVEHLSDFLDNISHILSPFRHYADAA